MFSSSTDKSVKVWSLDEMSYIETVFGHQDAVMSIDAMMKERAVSVGGRDNTVRVWKIVEESQFVYTGLGLVYPSCAPRVYRQNNRQFDYYGYALAII